MLLLAAKDNQSNKVYYLGLNQSDINRLLEGQQVIANFGDGGAGMSIPVTIFFGGTDQDLYHRLKVQGLTPPEFGYREATDERSEIK